MGQDEGILRAFIRSLLPFHLPVSLSSYSYFITASFQLPHSLLCSALFLLVLAWLSVFLTLLVAFFSLLILFWMAHHSLFSVRLCVLCFYSLALTRLACLPNVLNDFYALRGVTRRIDSSSTLSLISVEQVYFSTFYSPFRPSSQTLLAIFYLWCNVMTM